MVLNKLFGLLSHDVGIDLGTANTLVMIKEQGIVIREPSVVARHIQSGSVLAIGKEAKRMMGKTPADIEVIRPLRDGVIADFDAAEAMLKYYIKQVHSGPGFWHKVPRPRVAVGIPSGVTEVESRAVSEAALSAGAREAFLIEEPMAAAIGAGLKVQEPEGRMVVDIGGGTAEIAVISMGGIVLNRSIRVAGDEFDESIIRFVRMKHGLIIGERTAEMVKISVGSAYAFESRRGQSKRSAGSILQTVVRGRDLETGLPKSIKINSTEVREALAPVVQQIVESVKDTLEETPPELVADIMQHGIVLAGGTSLLRGLEKLIAEETKMPVWRMDEPMTGVVRGCGVVLDNPELLKKVKVVGGLRI